jgi:hypothetical protein
MQTEMAEKVAANALNHQSPVKFLIGQPLLLRVLFRVPRMFLANPMLIILGVTGYSGSTESFGMNRSGESHGVIES